MTDTSSTAKVLCSASPLPRKARLEPLEDRQLLSVSSALQPVALDVIDDYGDALFGGDWATTVGISAAEIQQHLADDTWRGMFNVNGTPAMSYIGEAAQYLGAGTFQQLIDPVFAAANLSRLDVRDLDWFKDPLIGPSAAFGDFFPESYGDLTAAANETMTAAPMALGGGGSPTVSISPSATSIIEQNGFVGLSVVLSGEATDGFTVEWRTVNGSATGGGPADPVDFVHGSGLLMFSDGEEGTSQGIGVQIKDDTLEEIDETFGVLLFNLRQTNSTTTNPTSMGNSSSTVTIIDNDPRVSISDASPVSEADPGDASPLALFSVTLSKSRPYSISVLWGAADGNPGDPPAVWTADYFPTGGEVYFAPGETAKQVQVPIRNDDCYEPTEYFYARLTSASGAIINDPEGRGTIDDDDPMPTLAVDDVTVNESDGTATLTVTMIGCSSLPVTVEWAVQDVQAVQPDDYSASAYSGTLTFSPGMEYSTAAVSFAIVDDTLTEPDETFRLTLSNPSNATIADGTGIVTILANDPKADIDVDSNNDGAINDADDPIEIDAPGKIVAWNRDDDDGNGLADYVDAGPVAAADDDLVPFKLALKQSGLPQETLDDLRLTLVVSQAAAFIKVWDSRTKDNQIDLPTTWTVAQLPGTLYVEGVAGGNATLGLTLYEESTWQTLDMDYVLVTVNFVDLIGHTPETVPFVRQPIPFANEEDPGVYIRRNGDDDSVPTNGPDNDPNDRNIAGENDLIYVRIDTAFAVAAGIQFVLERSSPDINVWTTSAKAAPILTTQDQMTLTFPGGVPASVWVEWVTPGIDPAQSTLTLRMQDSVSGNTVFTDQIVFHPFQSIVIVLGGEGQVPADPVLEADPLNHGTFQSAIDLYREGYDVHMYNEDGISADGSGIVYNEIASAIQKRGVTNVAIFGYSHGGGATHDLAEGLNDNRGAIGTFDIRYTAYIDAVSNSALPNPAQENERPPGTLYHLNIYQENGPFELGGGPLDNPQPQDDEIDVTQTTWGADLGHGDIDDNLTVRGLVRDRLRDRVNR